MFYCIVSIGILIYIYLFKNKVFYSIEIDICIYSAYIIMFHDINILSFILD